MYKLLTSVRFVDNKNSNKPIDIYPYYINGVILFDLFCDDIAFSKIDVYGLRLLLNKCYSVPNKLVEKFIFDVSLETEGI